MTRTNQVNVRLSEKLQERLDKMMERTGLTASEITRAALDEYLRKREDGEMITISPNIRLVKTATEVTAYLLPPDPAPGEKGKKMGAIYETERGWLDAGENVFGSPEEWVEKLREEVSQ